MEGGWSLTRELSQPVSLAQTLIEGIPWVGAMQCRICTVKRCSREFPSAALSEKCHLAALWTGATTTAAKGLLNILRSHSLVAWTHGDPQTARDNKSRAVALGCHWCSTSINRCKCTALHLPGKTLDGYSDDSSFCYKSYVWWYTYVLWHDILTMS